ncbi:hypothetical protein NQ317_000096 [Molorchus minor]|uniref:Uncharacterized protein n=1 Tax=Molorchus minor TaxID=1323400 RepID=A0ABQ9J159_9CUCU|nr:hypothetical protein NQ317_000096 [Molorchus minor]
MSSRIKKIMTLVSENSFNVEAKKWRSVERIMVSNVDLGFLALTLVAVKRRNHKKKKRQWSKDWYKMRNRFTHQHLLNFLSGSEPEDYRNFLRMDQEREISMSDSDSKKSLTLSQSSISPNGPGYVEVDSHIINLMS